MLGADDELDDQEGSDDGQSSHPSVEEPLFDTDTEFSEGERVEGAPVGEADGAGADQGAHHAEVGQGARAKEDRRARGITRPVSPTKKQLEDHYLSGHAVYMAGCECCLRCRGRADGHSSAQKDSKEYLDGEDEIPMCIMDFCFLAQEEQDKATPTLVIKEHRKKYLAAQASPG